jgi:hypothetical protein
MNEMRPIGAATVPIDRLHKPSGWVGKLSDRVEGGFDACRWMAGQQHIGKLKPTYAQVL